MGINEIVGFLIVLFIFFFPILRKLLINKEQKKHPARQQKEEPEVEESLPLPPPAPVLHHETHRTVEQDFSFHTSLEKRKLTTHVAPQKVTKKKQAHPLRSFTRGKTIQQNMVILSEIMGPPKSMQ